MIKVLTIAGTRPEAIKVAPVILELEANADEFDSVVCVTGQHREMLDQVLTLFGISPQHDLDVMEESQSLSGIASRVFSGLHDVLQVENPDWVLVQGDTTTVMAGSVAAFYHGVRVGHVEAGLRTDNKWKPFPEEINRRVAGVVADLHFAPTETARENLLRENVESGSILVTGNTVIDAMLWVAARPVSQSVISGLRSAGIRHEPQPGTRRILVTAHRRENHGPGLESVCEAIRELADQFGPSIEFVYPVHLSPKVQEPAKRILAGVPNVILCNPLDYESLVTVMKSCHLVLTDSGGLQEEAPGLGKPVLVLREETERPEGIEAGTVELVGTNRDRIVTQTALLLEDVEAYRRMSNAVNPYGDGYAAGRIVDALRRSAAA